MAFKCSDLEGNEAVLMTADSRVSGGRIIGETSKITPIYYTFTEEGEDKVIPLALASGSGDGAIVRQMIRKIEKILVDHLSKHWELSCPTFEQFEDVIEEAQYEFWKLFNSFRTMGGIDPEVRLVVCGLDPSGKASMYEFDSRGVFLSVHDSPGYICLGSGLVTGGSLIIKQFLEKFQIVETTLALSAYTMNAVSKIDTTVGPFDGCSYYFRIEEGHPVLGELHEDQSIRISESTAVRESALKHTWRLCELYGDETVFARLSELMTELARTALESDESEEDIDSTE
jgi:20S proteasome alpha/beta subunit